MSLPVGRPADNELAATANEPNQPQWEDTQDDGDWGGRVANGGNARARDSPYVDKLRFLLLLLDRGASNGRLPLEVVKKLDLRHIFNADIEFPLGLLLINAVGKVAAR